MKIQALIAHLAATTTAATTDGITIIATTTATTTGSTTFAAMTTATTTDDTTIAATTTVVSIRTTDEIGQMDSNLVRIAAADQITSLPTSMSHAQSVTTMSSTIRSSTDRAPCTRTPNTR